jgi:2-methylcitrate dehydratase PrpD
MGEPMTIAAGLAEFCSNVASRPLPAAVEDRARLCLADHLHAAIHGMRSETGERLVRYLAPDGAPAQLDAEVLALLLGAASTVHEIDDVHQDTSMHPGSVIVSAALACLMEKPISGRLLLAAIAAGYEVGIRLSIAAGERHYHYFHATATCGTLAAAATAAIILGLDREQTAHALGAAATSAGGLWEDINDAAIGLKHLHSGFAAERGIRAAKLAKLGLRGARRSIEGAKGFLAAMARPGDFAPRETVPDDAALREMLLAGLGERWTILRNIYKRYPFCLACFEPLEGIRHIVARSGRAKEDVRSVAVDIYPPNASLIDNPDPKDQLQAKFSAPFAIGLVLAGHDPEDVRLPKEWLADPKVRGWYPSISVRADSDVPRRHARVTVAWRDGAEESADRPLRNLDEKEVWGRFTAATRRYLGDEARAVEEAVAGCAALADTRGLPAVVRKAIGV